MYVCVINGRNGINGKKQRFLFFKSKTTGYYLTLQAGLQRKSLSDFILKG